MNIIKKQWKKIMGIELLLNEGQSTWVFVLKNNVNELDLMGKKINF